MDPEILPRGTTWEGVPSGIEGTNAENRAITLPTDEHKTVMHRYGCWIYHGVVVRGVTGNFWAGDQNIFDPGL